MQLALLQSVELFDETQSTEAEMEALKRVPDGRPTLRGLAAPVKARWTLSSAAAYRLAAGVIVLGLFASVTPSPLYRTYSVVWDFSPLTLTLIYATYAFGVLATLLLAGGVSDEVGRRPVLLVALAGLMGSTLLFLVADSAAWLFAARGLQGLATGAALSAASASLLDLHPRRDPGAVGLTNGVAAAGGIGLGMLVSSSLVQIGWEPRLLPYLVLLVLFAAAFAGAWLMPEPVEERPGFRLTIERPYVPAVVRRPFVLAALAVLSSWSIGALFFSLGPQLAGQLFGTTNAVVSGAGIVVLAASAVVAQLLTGRSAPWLATSSGSIALAGGIVLIAIAAGTGSTVLYLAGSIIGGAGFGAAFLGGLRALVTAIPPEHRAATMSAFYVAAYASLSVPAVLAGVAVTYISLQSTFEIFGSVVAAIGLVVAFEAWRTRPAARPQPRVVDPRPIARKEVLHDTAS
jgi:predicted MFS family arabinose efflux permease